MHTLEEQKANREKLVEALESGRYKQVTGHLRSETAFCCLGVACDVVDQAAWHRNQDGIWGHHGGRTAILPKEVREALGFSKGHGEFEVTPEWLETIDKDIADLLRHDDQWSLIELNDDLGLNFKEIAMVIRSNPPGLFVDNTVAT